MNTEKLYAEVMNDEELKDIPAMHIIKTICSVIKAINRGECFDKTEV